MEIVRLENEQNEQFALEIPLQEEYIQIKRYEPYGQPIDKKTITTITKDMYIEWNIREHYRINPQKHSKPTYRYGRGLPCFEQSVYDCYKYGFYTEQDILDYQNFIQQQDSYEDIDLSKTYYDNRAINGLDKDFVSSKPIEYNKNNARELPQKNGEIPFWIEIHSQQPYICFQANVIILEEKQYLMLDSNNKYAILEACRVFAALKESFFPLSSRIYIQNLFRFCLNSFEIAKVFGLIPDEYNICSSISPFLFPEEIEANNNYHIYPIDRYNGELIIKKIPENINIFKDYGLTFERCTFTSEKENKKSTLRLEGELNANFIDKSIEFNACTFKVGVYVHTAFYKKISFKNSVFEDSVSFDSHFYDEADFQSVIFKKEADFKNSIFEKQVSFQKANFYNKTTFDKVKFQNKIDEIECESIVKPNTTFEQNINFSGAIFDDNAEFDGANFLRKAFFCGTQFKKDVFFSNSTFQEADFSQSKFYQNAYFYGVTFQNLPNFIQAIFNENVNFTNTELDFGFVKVKNEIKETCNKRKEKYDSKKDKEHKEEPKEYKIANEFRDSFRTIKSALIKDNNMLDASNYHRIELYCKELELEYKRKEESQKSGIRDFIDRIQLMFYRLTSDHHTDLLLILNNVIILIACFGATNFILNLICNRDYFDFTILKVNAMLYVFFTCIIFIVLTLCLMLGCCGKLLHYFRDTNNIKLFLSKIFYEKQYKGIYFRDYVVFLSYIITTIIFLVNPILFLPILGQLFDIKSNLGFTFASLNILYAILMFLLIFSLQKTARKNTIVPS